MKFNFQCWALVRIDYPDDPEDFFPVIVGFWPTSQDADAGRDALEHDRMVEHDRREDEYKRKFSFKARLDYKPAVYVKVPLSQMRFDSLSDAENMIEQAAKLMFKGCGVSA